MPDVSSVIRSIAKLRQKTCPHCLKDYTLGLDGITTGCDECEGIVRTPGGAIDFEASSPENFIIFMKQEGQS